MTEQKISFHEFLVNSAEKTNAKAVILSFISYKRGDINASEVTNLWLFKFKDYLIEKNMAANSRAKYTNVLQSIIRRAINRGYECPCSLDEIKGEMSVQPEASEAVYLTLSELMRLDAYVPKTNSERFSKAAFLIGCCTGARISDVISISENNISGKELLFNSKKTKSTSRVPLHPSVMGLLNDIKGHTYDEHSIRVVVGRDIKNICKSIGMTDNVTLYRRGTRMTTPKWKVISCHTSRKTFVTLLYLDGWKLPQISRMVGHSNTTMTEKYLCISYDDDVTGMKTFFKSNVDVNYDKLVQMIGFGLSVDQACCSLGVNGVSQAEGERVRLKYNNQVA